MTKLRFRLRASAQERDAVAALEQESRAAATRDYWCRKFGDPELDEIIEEHRAWVESRGKSGKKAELAGANFEQADLLGAELRGANLLRANLRGADLLLADLRGACLIEADLRGANLVSTNLRGTSLAGANLASATGLVARQLGGASLIGAALPGTFDCWEGLAASALTCRILRILLVAMIFMCACFCAVVAMTKDAGLVKNSATPIPLLGHFLPILAFYLAAPMILVTFYVVFHLHLQKLWEAMEELPSVFPDGRRLSQCVSASMLALAPRELCEPEREMKTGVRFERLIAQAFAYWMVPATLVLIWARYLTEQDWRGSLLQIFFILAASTISGFLPRNETSIFAAAQASGDRHKRIWNSWRMGSLTIATAASCLLLVILSLGVILGAPRQLSRAPALGAHNFRRWAADAFWLAGYDPFPNLNGARISDAPRAWSGKLSDLSAVKGARLRSASLRYARASRAFFANTDLQNADLSGADFFEADFRGANLASANLFETTLQRADFQTADLRYATLAGASAGEAEFDGANFYEAVMAGVQMDRASFAKTDLRGAILQNAELNQADFSAAYLGKAKLAQAHLESARFNAAFMDGADLQNADLRSATFAGAILNDTNLRGAKLDNADLRGALGLTAAQICAARSRHGALMDAPLSAEVDALCGAP